MIVWATKNIENVKKGMVGTIVHVNSEDSFEVEFPGYGAVTVDRDDISLDYPS